MAIGTNTASICWRFWKLHCHLLSSLNGNQWRNLSKHFSSNLHHHFWYIFWNKYETQIDSDDQTIWTKIKFLNNRQSLYINIIRALRFTVYAVMFAAERAGSLWHKGARRNIHMDIGWPRVTLGACRLWVDLLSSRLPHYECDSLCTLLYIVYTMCIQCVAGPLFSAGGHPDLNQ
jgi:hypothetical protein